MRIACPSCNAAYQVPDEQLGEGRVVRCVRCGTDWSPVVSEGAPSEQAEAADGRREVPAEPPPEALPEPLVEPEPVRRMALDDDPVVTVAPVPAEAVPVAVVAPARRGGPWLAIAWVLSVMAVVGGIAGLVVWREAVMQAWPPSIRAYAGVGLAARP